MRKRQGVDIWGVTVQNEPAATQSWDSCVYSAQEERDFVRDHLGPTLERAGLGHVKIIIWDHNRDLLVERARAWLISATRGEPRMNTSGAPASTGYGGRQA